MRINRANNGGKKKRRKQLLSNERSLISVVSLGIRHFRYPRSLGSIFIMPSIGANFFGKACGVCGNLLEKQFPLFLYALFPSSQSASHHCSFTRFNRIYHCTLTFKSETPFAFSHYMRAYWEDGEIFFCILPLVDRLYFSNIYGVLGIELSVEMIWNERKIRYRDLHLRKGSRSHCRTLQIKSRWIEGDFSGSKIINFELVKFFF